MLKKLLVTAFAVAAGGLMVHAGQQRTPAAYTESQAAKGKSIYQNTCGKCHTYSLQGRQGEDGELPPLSSLSAAYQGFVKNSGRVPPLAGKVFLSRWGQKTVAELIARFQITASDPFFQFEGLDDEGVVNLTAYVLQVNGAKAGPQPLTRTSNTVVNSIVP
jgi:mono/diheme cytochrome c family protein